MKKVHTLMIAVLGLTVISCSHNNLAQVENDDMYFSKKDRKEVNTQAQLAKEAPNEIISVEPQAEQSITKETVAQQPEEFYDSTKDPDYVPGYHQSGQEETAESKVSEQYYVENNGSYSEVARSTTPVTNNYYFYDRSPYSSPYYSSYNPYGYYGAPYGSSISLSFSFGSGFYGRPYYDPFYSGFNSFYSPFYTSSFYGPSSFYGGYRYNSFYGSPYCYYPTAVPYNSYVVYEGRSTYNGRNVVAGPRRSRGAISPSAQASRTVARQISSREGRINGGNIDNDTRSSSRVTSSRASRTSSSYRNRGAYQPTSLPVNRRDNGTRSISNSGTGRSVKGRNTISTSSRRSTGTRKIENTNSNKNNSAVNRSDQRNRSVSRNVNGSSASRNNSGVRRNTGFLSNNSQRSGNSNRSRSIGSSNRNRSSGFSGGGSRNRSSVSRSSGSRSSVSRSSGSRSSSSHRSSVSPSRSSSRSKAPSRSSGSKSSSSRSGKKN